MTKQDFTHLHVHTEYSLLDGSSKIEVLLNRAKELNMHSLAITDHGVMFGIIDFYKKAINIGIKPILGCEIYVASGSRFYKERSRDNFYYHLVLLAENNTGYKNLIKLVSYGFTEGFYYKPRVDIELLNRHHEGLIALSACLGGPIAKNILNVSYAKAKEMAVIYNNIFGADNFYMELQDHGENSDSFLKQKQVNEQIVKISQETGIPIVCTNDSHYTYKEDAEAHDILLCIQTGKTMQDDNRMTYSGGQYYLKSSEEMYELFRHVPSAIDNTSIIAKRCNVTLDLNTYKLPEYPMPSGEDKFEYMKHLCIQGLQERYSVLTVDIKSRLDYELDTIRKMGFIDYFLITWDFIKYARDNDIKVGPGRGSAAGSLVSYSLYITNVDPLENNLLFERFLNSERISMPDIDIDFCYERRQEVIDYVISKYGQEKVSQIITFGTMAARASIRDVGRVLSVPYAEVDVLAKMIPNELGITIKKALTMSADLKSMYAKNPGYKYLIDMAMSIEGLPRHVSTHAAGIIICNTDTTDYVPLYKSDNIISTQFTMLNLEDIGLLKMDFLGLRTLTVIQNTLIECKRNYGVDINIDKVSYNDEEVFKLISNSDTEGVFQLESLGMKSFMKELKPNSLDDIVAGISLYRPGPMDFIPKYIMGKRDPAAIRYTHKSLEPILKETYGCIVYQEQVMQIVRDLAGYSLARSDLVRRMMSKKKSDVMEQERKNFIYGLDGKIKGCIASGIDEIVANQIFNEMVDFAKYAFNKSHAACYAFIAYQTAWLKVHYPIEFMAALMTSVIDNSSKLVQYIYDLKKMRVKLYPPDINEGFKHFRVVNSGIMFGLLAIKGVGSAMLDVIIKNREQHSKFRSLTDFIDRLAPFGVNKKILESLIKSGAMDSLGNNRRSHMESYQAILKTAQNNRNHVLKGQISLFTDNLAIENKIYYDSLSIFPEYDKNTLLAYEKEVLGIYTSGHPLSEYSDYIVKNATATSLDFLNAYEERSNIFDGKVVKVGGIIVERSIKYTKNDMVMAFINIEDLYGVIEVIVFPNVYERYKINLIDDKVVLVEGRVSMKEEDVRLICSKILLLPDSKQAIDKRLWIKIDKRSRISVNIIRDVLINFKGSTPVIIYDEHSNQKMSVNSDFWVDINDDGLLGKLTELLGPNCVALK